MVNDFVIFQSCILYKYIYIYIHNWFLYSQILKISKSSEWLKILYFLVFKNCINCVDLSSKITFDYIGFAEGNTILIISVYKI